MTAIASIGAGIIGQSDGLHLADAGYDVVARPIPLPSNASLGRRPWRCHGGSGLCGSVPELVDLPPGCPFAGRCAYTIDACVSTRPPPIALPSGDVVRCIRLGDLTPTSASTRTTEAVS